MGFLPKLPCATPYPTPTPTRHLIHSHNFPTTQCIGVSSIISVLFYLSRDHPLRPGPMVDWGARPVIVCGSIGLRAWPCCCLVTLLQLGLAR